MEFLNFFDSFVGGYRNSPLESIIEGTNGELINTAIEITMGFSISARWAFDHGIWVLVVNSSFDL
jgi:hypothetical protein